ncbi:hypothetical protein NCLIV_034670 [Neospora caninum Liverpool]|uniref:Translation initiation factor eIF-2B subunit epsilon n=1 Tax=Neospora caninum (strain Liverpool) TaxID=572307 RepID=F0VIX4_NEOCL|nr:hypothetical protein NCLIV_034670 [Neospora caninum Liverpool]CBZ53685.1 hypothetical protein NCLIV_034670 [Neospora caninum Liverpool]CEL67676.1 TPA: Translation initiation factor eIF-2B subunit epsilon [Neospora caninum Liverpool]|eukprot:XP_003883717.1 hypothetical protein NCLIV_034670 [Neospora caninum Liverpool]
MEGGPPLAPQPGEEGEAKRWPSFLERMKRVTSTPLPARSSPSFVSRALSALSVGASAGAPGATASGLKRANVKPRPSAPPSAPAASASREDESSLSLAPPSAPVRLPTLSSADLATSSLPSLLRAFSLPEERTDFLPLAEEIPPALLPVCGVPLIVFALDFLARNGVTDVFVLLRNNEEGEAVQKVVEEQQPSLQRRFASRGEPLQIVVVFVAPTVETLGDALRDFDSRVNLTKDFLLLSATTFIVADIRDALENHRARSGKRQTGRAAEQLVTQIFSSLPAASPRRHLSDDVGIVLNGETKEMIKRVSLRSRTFLGVDEMTLLQAPGDGGSGNLEVHYDLVDAGVYICSPKVLKIFRYSFDFQSMTRDFIPAVVRRDIKLHAVFAHTLKEKAMCSEYKPFAAQVTDPRSYFNACQSVVERWLYPIVPEVLSIFLGQARLRYKGAGTYQADSVVLGSRCEVGPLTVLEDRTEVGEDSSVRASFLGASCSIGKGVVIEGSILLDHVQVADGAVIRDSILFPFASVKRGAEISRGCLLGKHVLIGEERSIQAFTRIHLPSPDSEASGPKPREPDSAREHSAEVVGGDGRGVCCDARGGPVEQEDRALTSPGASIAPAVALPVPRFSRCPEDDPSADQLLSCAIFPVSAKGRVGLEALAVSAYNAGLDEKLFSLCAGYLQSSSFEEQQDRLCALEEYLAAGKFFADKAKVTLPARHALRAFLFHLATLSPANPEVWRCDLAEHRVEALFLAVLPADRFVATDFFPLWTECLAFCQQAAFCVPSSQLANQKAGDSEDATGDSETVAPNPLHSPAAFCSLVETMQACGLLECETTLPLWYAYMVNVGKGADEYLSNPRFIAFCQWLEQD